VSLSSRLAAVMVVLMFLTAMAVGLLIYSHADTQSALLAIVVTVLFAVCLAVIVARSLTKPLVQMTAAVEGFARDGGLAAPTNASGEIGVLARAFERMRADVREKTDAVVKEIKGRNRLFETSLDLILITDKRGKFIQVSPSSAAILGYSPDEMIDRVGSEFIFPDDLETTRQEMRLARQGRVTRNFETRYVHKDGRVVELAWSGVWSEPEQQHFFIGRDMTERNRLEETERQAKEMLGAVIDASPIAIVCIAPDRRVMVWSRAAEQIFGFSAEETVGQPYKLVPAGNEEEFDGLFERALEGETLRDVRVVRQRKDGSLVDLSFDAAAMYDSDGVSGVAYALTDITERKKIEEQLKYLAHYDQLTGLPNRFTLQNELKELIDLSMHPDGQPTSVVLFDLDGVKDINDTIGHSVGDKMLKEVAKRLSTIAGDRARVYRLDGDEFVVTIPHCGDPRTVGQIADTMLTRLAERFEINGHVLYIGASAGIAIAPADGLQVEDVIANADLALHDARSSGGQRYRLFVPVLRAQAQARRELDSELRRAFVNHEFELYFQPQLRLSDDAVVGAEALLRWRHPIRGVLAPALFIEALAQSQIVRDAGSWILQTACEQTARWRAMGLQPVRIGVNLFPAQFHDGALQQDVEAALLKAGLSAECLELEITENIALGHDEKMLASLRALRETGVGLAFDDFGTGYASLSYLTRYPLSRIKIDRSFVQRITDDRQDAAIVRSIIVMAHNLGLKVIAEGVETAAQAEFLRAEGCEEVQGFLYAKPLPAADFEMFLRAKQLEPKIRARAMDTRAKKMFASK